jgi:hypothetical protein
MDKELELKRQAYKDRISEEEYNQIRWEVAKLIIKENDEVKFYIETTNRLYATVALLIGFIAGLALAYLIQIM